MLKSRKMEFVRTNEMTKENVSVAFWLKIQVLASSESPGILDVPGAGLLALPKEPPMALTDHTDTEQKKDEPIVEDNPSYK